MIKEYKTENIRNVAIIGHGGTGKSSILEAMLYINGKIDKLGSAEAGTLVSDFEDDEKTKKISIRTSMGFVEMDNIKINVLDAPGTADFVGEAHAALLAVETAILVVDAVDGVQIETQKAWRFLNDHKIPRIIFVNKMDKERADYHKVIDNIKDGLKARVASLCIPDGEGENIKGVVDTIEMKFVTPKMPDAREILRVDIPDHLKAIAEKERKNLVELSAEGDDELTEKFLNGEELTEEEVKRGIREELGDGRLNIIVCGSAKKRIGIKNLLNMIKNYAPAPYIGIQHKAYDPDNTNKSVSTGRPDEPFLGVVWKTFIDQYAGRFNYIKVVSGELAQDTEVYNANKKAREKIGKIYAMIGNRQFDLAKLNYGDIGVAVKLEKTSTKDTLCDPKRPAIVPMIQLPNPVYSYAVEAVNKQDEDKLGQFMHRIMDENPTISYGFNAETKESVISGMGEMQIDVILKNLKEKNKIEVRTRLPRIAYRETITKKAEAQYKHKKQSGGHGQYGEVYLRLAPRPRGAGYEFKDSIVGGVVPKNYIPGVQKGLIEGMDDGFLARYPVVDIMVELFDGSYHDVDSSELSFKLAARGALKKGLEMAGPQLLEPVMEVSIYVDSDLVGDVLNDITGRRGRVLGMENQEGGSGITVVKATVPLSEMLRYTIDLRAMTSGKGSFEMKFDHYDPISGKIAEKVIEERKKFFEDEANK